MNGAARLFAGYEPRPDSNDKFRGCANVVLRGDVCFRVQLEQVLINLVLNACDAMAALDAPDRQLIVRTEVAAGAGVLVSVVDQGCGIPAEHVEKIFESFFTTKTQGMGLGLSVCRSIVSAHGGRLWAENNPDRGATFRFWVPLDKAA